MQRPESRLKKQQEERERNRRMPKGQKHLIQCHCILPQYRGSENPVFHKFVVFSLVEDDNSVREKISNCNNCGIAHKVVDLCKSEILFSNEDVKASFSVEDFKLSLPSAVFELLDSYKKGVDDYEYAQFIIDYDKWGTKLILTREEINGKTEGKILNFLSKDKYRVESYSWSSTV